MTLWFLAQDTADELRFGASRLQISAADRQAFAAEVSARASSTDSGILSCDGDTATLNVSGVLVEQPSLLMWLLGVEFTTYSAIRSALGIAAADSSVTSLVLNVSSSGGAVDGLFSTLETLEGFSKPKSVVTSNAQSAAYAIAAAGGKIRATHAASLMGSVGVATEILVNDRAVQIANSDSPRKRPDVRTTEGVSAIRDTLDAIFDEFVGAVARGRGTTTANVREGYGRGASLTARQALGAGMIDSVGSGSASTGSAGATRHAVATGAPAARGWLPPMADLRRRVAAERERNAQ